ncbi:DNA-binding protein [Spirochaetia bacterium]|nr:DNA-binding protein [Spirochaetia bacterium]
MPSTKVDISPNIIDWILKTVSFGELDDKFLSHLYKWKNEETLPTYAQIESLSQKTHIPLGYFFLKTPPAEDIPLLKFRTINSTTGQVPSRDLIDTYYHMESIQDWMRDYLIDLGNEKLPFVGACKNNTNIEGIADTIRNTAGLSLDWYFQSNNADKSFNIARKYFENIGIIIIRNGVVGQNNFRPLNIDEFRAFTLIDDYAPLVFINSKDSANGRLFSLFHEIVHIWIGLHSFFNNSSILSFNISPLETLCNAVAAELLAPNKIFIREWYDRNHLSVDEKIVAIAKYFTCGKTVIARRALGNNFIDQVQYAKIAETAINLFKNEKIKQEGGNYYAAIKQRYGNTFILALDNSIREGKTLYTEAFKLTNTNRNTFANLVAEVRGFL